MRADNTHHLAAATRRRVEATHRRARTALRRLDNTGRPVNFESLAKEARVSRSWLYSQPELRAEIERLRDRHQPRQPHPSVPPRQRASDASLLRRLEAATDRLRKLEAENQTLREALAYALGQRRIDDVTSRSQ
ncbi:DUF6262 family protein [Micromonospora radicis]|uniref:Transposase n=1 Tax=Micromonospora radicis TaxID=1894971 RepID=A0A418MMJ0_9ACTN|nr:DUF6262 family protein [Micromonospora radicis]RIV29797.1 transposase [Micromonospora radicis]